MSTIVDPNQLQSLFEAFSKDDEEKFVRTAEAIIQRELSANHYGAATVLRQALASREPSSNKMRELSSLPRDRRSGDDLLWLIEPKHGLDQLSLDESTATRLRRVIREHQARAHLKSFGLRPSNKVLFWGPPGNGKTVAAFALGYELGLPVASVRLDSLISSYLGDTASHVSRIFSRALATPMILLLDEIDAIGKRRDDPRDVGELKRIVNTLLQQMDRTGSGESVFVAASNHQHLLDAALWRRFDDIIEFPQPSSEQRQRLLKNLLRGVRVQGEASGAVQASTGMSCADIESCMHEAIKSMVLDGNDKLTVPDLISALRAFKSNRNKARHGMDSKNEYRLSNTAARRARKVKTKARKTKSRSN
jgi:SpoVK/Ycf46/Vps4 family AAA+-type ATPase